MIEYSIDGVWKTIVDTTANDGLYDWNIPSDTSSNVMLRISDVENRASDENNYSITHVAPVPPTA